MQVRPIFSTASLQRLGTAPILVAGLPPRAAARVAVDRLPLDAATLAVLRGHAARRRPVDLVLATGLFLPKTVRLPRAAARAAADAIDMQLRQDMPARAAGLVWRAEPLPRKGGVQPYRVHVFKQQELTALLQAASGTGAEVRRVLIDTAAPVPPLFHRRSRADRITQGWHVLAAVLALAALGAVLGPQAWRTARLDAETAALEAELATLLDEAAALKAQAVARDAARGGLVADVARFNADYRRFPLIADLTDRLDDGVWISSFALDGDTLRLAGFSRADLAQTVRAVQAAPWAAEVAIDGPVVVDPVRQENRFQLRVTLRPPEVPL